LGVALRGYAFNDHFTKEDEAPGAVHVMVNAPDEVKAAGAAHGAIAEGVFFTRDLVNEPANVLTTSEFADRLAELSSLGLKVKIMEEDELEKLGMGSLLCVGQGSDSPSKVVVMEWMGGKKDDAPFALVGKGVVFDTGGISLKPAGGMEDMTMDMGGAGVVAGVMEEEGAWRLPMGKAYDDQLKSRVADMKNVGTRAAGSITAAQFLQRFVKDETPWCHLDIAGVASLKTESDFAPKGATGWGVRALNRLIADHFEAE